MTDSRAPAPNFQTALAELAPLIPDFIQTDLVRYLVGAGAVFLIVNIALAGPLRSRKIRADTPGWTQIGREILASLRTVLVFALSGLVTALGYRMGWLRIYEESGQFGWLYFGVSIAAIIVLHDAWFYWTHRLIHHRVLFRRFHRLHHRSFNPTPWTSYAFNTGEAALNALFLPIFVAVVPVSFLAVIIFVTHMMIRNAIGHCGYELFPASRDGKPLIGWLTTVTHHDLHHAQAGSNYGLYFTWWDRWMRTENPRYLEAFAQAASANPLGSATRAH